MTYYPTREEYIRFLTNNTPRASNLPEDWATKVYDYIQENFPEELEQDGPRPVIDSHSVYVACFHLGYEPQDARPLVR